MSNMTYLCGTNDEQLYPSMRSSFDENQQIIAAAKYSLPIMWMLLFEDSDIVEATVITEDDDTLDTFAPLTSKEKALRILDQNTARISKFFEATCFERYHSLFRREVEESPFEFLTIELWEIDEAWRNIELRVRLASIYSELACESEPSVVSKLLRRQPKLLQLLCNESGYTPRRGLVEADCLIMKNHKGRDLENHWSMLGFNWQKPTTWDPNVDTPRGTSEELARS